MISSIRNRASKDQVFLLAGVCVASLGLSACVESSEEDVTPQDIQDQAAQTLDTTQAFAQEQVASYKESLLERVDGVETEIEMLESRAQALAGDAKEEIEAAIDDLRTRKDALVRRVRDAQADSQQAWTDLRAGLDRGWEELKNGVDEATERFGG